MTRKSAGRIMPSLETLEGRKLQSGLGGSPHIAGSSLLPYIEQDNSRPNPTGDGTVQHQNQTQIIAILIGL